MNLTDVEVNLLYSVYSLPNIILPFFGGYFIDKIGKRYSLGLRLSVEFALLSLQPSFSLDSSYLPFQHT